MLLSQYTSFNEQECVPELALTSRQVKHTLQLSEEKWGADLGGSGAVEGVGLQNVGPGCQELVVDAGNDAGAGDDQQVVVALQLIGVALEPGPPEVLLTQPVEYASQPELPTSFL